MGFNAHFSRCPMCGHGHALGHSCVIGEVPKVQSFTSGLACEKVPAALPGVVCLGNLPNNAGTSDVPADAGRKAPAPIGRGRPGKAAPKAGVAKAATADDSGEHLAKSKATPRGRGKK